LSVNIPGARSDYDQPSQTATITFDKQPIDQELRINVSGELADFENLSSQAQKRRGHGLDDQPEALLWTRGVGVIRSNDGPYGYGGQDQIRVYSPRGVLDHDKLNWVVDQQSGEADITGKPFTLPQPVDAKVISFHRKAQVAYSYQGKPIVIDLPVQFDSLLLSERNIARKARATASSTEQDYRPRGAIDGIRSGYPANKRAEWASNHEKEGAWVRLEWDAPQTIDTIAVFDRPNMIDQVTAGQISFSDGSTIGVGSLPDDASEPVEMHFAPRTVKWLEFKVAAVKPGTENAGICEIAVYSP
jgi:hypothetical protein